MDESPRHCEHCDWRSPAGAWSLIEVYPQRRYEWLCLHCQRQQRDTFTHQQAIGQALIIVGLRAGELNFAARQR